MEQTAGPWGARPWTSE